MYPTDTSPKYIEWIMSGIRPDGDDAESAMWCIAAKKLNALSEIERNALMEKVVRWWDNGCFLAMPRPEQTFRGRVYGET